MKTYKGVPLSVLDLAPINEGSTATQSFKNSTELIQHTEKLGFNRYWVAEHHNMPGIASSATAVLIGHLAGATETIRVGSGGIMLPNHAPLVIAEQFGTLEAMYPGRIDLGLGRAPGSDQATAYALRRTLNSSADEFPQHVEELQGYFAGTERVHAFPGEGADVKLWLLGSSGFSAQLAALKGLPFSFASHFSPDYTMQALQLYHQNFRPSEFLSEPYAMLGVNVIAAESEERARWLATSQQQQMFALMRGMPTQFKPPVDDIESDWSVREQALFAQTLQGEANMIGTPEQVREKLNRFIEKTKADEIIVNSQIFHQEDRLRSYELLADLMD